MLIKHLAQHCVHIREKAKREHWYYSRNLKDWTAERKFSTPHTIYVKKCKYFVGFYFICISLLFIRIFIFIFCLWNRLSQLRKPLATFRSTAPTVDRANPTKIKKCLMKTFHFFISFAYIYMHAPTYVCVIHASIYWLLLLPHTLLIVLHILFRQQPCKHLAFVCDNMLNGCVCVVIRCTFFISFASSFWFVCASVSVFSLFHSCTHIPPHSCYYSCSKKICVCSWRGDGRCHLIYTCVYIWIYINSICVWVYLYGVC